MIRLTGFLCGLVAMTLLCQTSFAAPSLDILVVSGDASPDGNGVFGELATPILNNAGQVGFYSTLTGTSGGATDSEGIFRIGKFSPFVTIVRSGDPVPDGNGTIALFNDDRFAMNGSGQVVFGDELRNTASAPDDRDGLYLGFGGALVQIARAGDPSPDGSGTLSRVTYSNPPLTEGGEAVFVVGEGPFDTDVQLVRGTGTAPPVAIAKEGVSQPQPGLTIGNIFNYSISDAGEVAFDADFSAPGPVFGNGVFRADQANNIYSVALDGDAAPDGNGTFSFSGATPPSVNDAGQVAFVQSLTGTIGGASDDQGIFVGNGIDPLTQIARKGDLAPDGNGNLSFLWFPIINNTGQTVFQAWLSGTSGGASDDVCKRRPKSVAPVGAKA